MLADVPLELREQRVALGHRQQVIVQQLIVLVVADRQKLQARFAVPHDRHLVEHAAEGVVQLVGLLARDKQGVGVLHPQTDGQRQVLRDEQVVVDPGDGDLFIEAHPRQPVHPFILQHIQPIIWLRPPLLPPWTRNP